MTKLRMAHASTHGARKHAWRTQAAWANINFHAFTEGLSGPKGGYFHIFFNLGYLDGKLGNLLDCRKLSGKHFLHDGFNSVESASILHP